MTIGGNGVVEIISTGATEACDDGNLVNGDGCSSTCGVKANYSSKEAGLHSIC